MTREALSMTRKDLEEALLKILQVRECLRANGAASNASPIRMTYVELARVFTLLTGKKPPKRPLRPSFPAARA